MPKVHHIGISTGNYDRALTFYRDALGFEVTSEFGWPQGMELADRITGLQDSAARVAMLECGGFFIELFEFASPTPKPADPDRPVCDHGYTHICLDVEDIDADYARLAEAGMPFHSPPQEMPNGNRVTYGRDPDGNVVELRQVGGAQPQ